MAIEHAYTGQPIPLPELSLKIGLFELGNFHWKVDFGAQGTLTSIRPPTNFAAHGAPWARILNHFVGSFWLDSVLLTEGGVLIDLGVTLLMLIVWPKLSCRDGRGGGQVYNATGKAFSVSRANIILLTWKLQFLLLHRLPLSSAVVIRVTSWANVAVFVYNH
jgi:hypothetical protein